MKNQKFLAMWLVLISLSAGCGVFKDVTQMKDDVRDMKQTTHDLKDTMKDVEKTMGNVNGTTQSLAERFALLQKQMSVLERENRMAQSAQLRTLAFGQLKDESIPPEEKLVQAAAFYRGFEFQFWQNINPGDLQERDVLLEEGLLEFLARFKGVINGKLTSPNTISNESREQALLILSATAEQVNAFQGQSASGPDFPALSMLDLLVQGARGLKEFDVHPGPPNAVD